MKKIVFVTGAMGRGGAERVISLLANFYVHLGTDVSILMLLHNRVEYELDERVKVINLSKENVNAVLDMPRLISTVRSYVKREKPDAVVAFMAQICLVTGFACRGLKTRLIQSERIDPSAVERGKIYEAILNHVYANGDVTVLQTKRARDYFPEKVRKNSVIIPNPIAVKCTVVQQRRDRIVTAGRLTKQKNQAMLIEAFAVLRKRYPKYTLDIYGEGPLQEELQAKIDALGLKGGAVLKGNVPNIHEEMADAEIFVLPSDFEGLSNALLEAMMMGLPCIATNCSGCDEVIEDGKNGLLIQVGDKNGLVKALTTLIEDSEYRTAIAKNAQQSAQRFYVETIIDEWNQVICGENGEAKKTQ